MKDYYASLEDIQEVPVRRAPTGIQSLDWQYGFSRFPGGIVWGMPEGKVSLWSGTSGTGKSRTAIQLAKNLVRQGYKVLYFQSEDDLPTFKGWVKDTSGDLRNFICSDVTDLPTMMQIIQDVRPSIVFVDSVNEIDQYGGGAKNNIKEVLKGKGVDHDGICGITKELKMHTILLAQLNQDGSIKGSTTLAHLVDIALDIVPNDKKNPDLFVIKIGIKHRYGRKGSQFRSLWMHKEEGVECISDFEYEDKVWCETHGIPIRDLREHFVKLMHGEEDHVVKKRKKILGLF